MDGEDAVGPLILVIRVHHVLLHALPKWQAEESYIPMGLIVLHIYSAVV